MGFVTASDPLLRAALWIGAGSLVLSCLLVLATLLLRLRLIAQAAHEKRFAEIWQPIFAACIDGVPDHVPMLAREDAALFLRMWLHAEESLRGVAQAHLAELAMRTEADRFAVDFLSSGDPAKELLALVALGHLRVRGAVPLARTLLQARSSALSIAAAQALLRIDPIREMRLIIATAAERSDWPTARIVSMLKEADPVLAGEALASAIKREIPPGGGEALVPLLRLLPAASPESVSGVVRRALKAEVPPEAVSAALDALWMPEDVNLARLRTADEAWFVRIAAAKAVGRLGSAEDTDLLIRMLADPNWWVRYRAARALARLPGVSRETLERLRDAADDRYAVDMLQHVISEQAPA